MKKYIIGLSEKKREKVSDEITDEIIIAIDKIAKRKGAKLKLCSFVVSVDVAKDKTGGDTEIIIGESRELSYIEDSELLQHVKQIMETSRSLLNN